MLRALSSLQLGDLRHGSHMKNTKNDILTIVLHTTHPKVQLNNGIYSCRHHYTRMGGKQAVIVTGGSECAVSGGYHKCRAV
jgi:hypothetical protein